MAKYQKQEAILKERNSYSKTDPDATFMRMKDDHMQNGQLKPAYNVQASSNNQYLTNYTLAQTTADTTTLKNHVNDHIDNYDEKPETLTADAGYGSEENYTDLEDKQITKNAVVFINTARFRLFSLRFFCLLCAFFVFVCCIVNQYRKRKTKATRLPLFLFVTSSSSFFRLLYC